MKVLLVEDDIVFSEILCEYLTDLNNEVRLAFEGEKAEELIFSQPFDLILLDIHIPKNNGLTVLQKIRENGFTTPVIVITSSLESDKIEKAFTIGCNDYIKKPFDFKELHARIKYIKKQYKIDFYGTINIDETYTFDFQNLTIFKNRSPIKIPKKEAEIIKYFLCNQNRVISFNELIINIWGYEIEPSISTIRTYIKNIRKLFNYAYIESIKGLGYKFTSNNSE